MGIYERIQQKELKSNEDHVTYVTKVEKSIVGMKTVSTHIPADTHSRLSHPPPSLPSFLPFSSMRLLLFYNTFLACIDEFTPFSPNTFFLAISFFPNFGGSPWPEFTVSSAVIVCPRISLQVLPANAGLACQYSSDSSAVFQTSRPCEGVGSRRQSGRKQFPPSVSSEFPKDCWG